MRNLPRPGIESMSLHWHVASYPPCHQGSSKVSLRTEAGICPGNKLFLCFGRNFVGISLGPIQNKYPLQDTGFTWMFPVSIPTLGRCRTLSLLCFYRYHQGNGISMTEQKPTECKTTSSLTSPLRFLFAFSVWSLKNLSLHNMSLIGLEK